MAAPARRLVSLFLFFFFNDTATTEIYTLSLHDALPISRRPCVPCFQGGRQRGASTSRRDRKSTRLNSSHVSESRMPSSACKKNKSSAIGIAHVRTQHHSRKHQSRHSL